MVPPIGMRRMAWYSSRTLRDVGTLTRTNAVTMKRMPSTSMATLFRQLPMVPLSQFTMLQTIFSCSGVIITIKPSITQVVRPHHRELLVNHPDQELLGLILLLPLCQPPQQPDQSVLHPSITNTTCLQHAWGTILMMIWIQASAISICRISISRN